ncbi:MAG: ABC transporter ATP-binding protein [Motilibacteraceae bacterium]
MTKVYEPTPRWMRLLARTHIQHPVHALNQVDLTVGAGQICAVVGPNGAGKTTLFRIIVGLTTSSAGTGTVFRLDVGRDSQQVRQVVGWMPAEDRSLLMRATCRENLLLHGRLQGMPRKPLSPAVDDVLATVGLAAQRDAIVASLSAGMKARLRLARALLPSPRALILDEPTGAVDPVAAHALLRLIQDLVRDRRLAVLVSSHRLEEIEALHSHALLLDGGRVRYSGDLEELREAWDHPLVELTLTSGSTARSAAERLSGLGIEVDVDGAVVRLRPHPWSVGDLIGTLGPFAAQLERVREVPLPLRDLIAKVYADGRAEEAVR